MKCPNCNETYHVRGVKYCHICGHAIPSNEHAKVLSAIAVVAAIVVIAFIICSFCRTNSSIGLGFYDYKDTESEYNWRFNRRLDPNKYDYILNGTPEPPPVTGTLKVNSVPEGARIYLDGKKTGLVTPATIEGIQEGKHKITVRLRGMRVRNTWYHKGTGTYTIFFNFYGEGIPTVSERP